MYDATYVAGSKKLRLLQVGVVHKYIYNKLSKHLNVLSIILITIALTLLPDSAVAMMNEKYQGMLYFLSFLCWFIGLYFLSIKSEYKNRIENK